MEWVSCVSAANDMVIDYKAERLLLRIRCLMRVIGFLLTDQQDMFTKENVYSDAEIDDNFQRINEDCREICAYGR